MNRTLITWIMLIYADFFGDRDRYICQSDCSIFILEKLPDSLLSLQIIQLIT